MKVGFLDPVVVDDGEPADAGARQVLQHRAAQPAGADHQRRDAAASRAWPAAPTSGSTIWRA